MSQEAHLSPQLLLEKQRRTRWWWIVGICAVLAIPAVPGLGYLYKIGKAWRARQLSHQAEDLILSERWEEAASKARVAYQLKIDEPDAIRAVAHLQSASGHPGEALAFWRQLDEMKVLTPADRRARAEDLFRVGALADAEKENSALLGDGPEQPAALRLAARLAAAKGNHEQAVDYARQAQKADPENQDGKLLSALLQFDSADPAARDGALQALLELGHNRGRNGLSALTALASWRDLSMKGAGEAVSLLRDHPLATEGQKLLSLDLEIAAEPSGRSAVLDRICAEYATGEPAKKRALGVWLNAHAEWERTLKLLPAAEASQRKDLLLVHLDALAALKRWEEIQKLLDVKDVPLDPVYIELFQARSAMELGETTIAELHWTRAITEAAASTEQMWEVGKYAEMIGQTDQAERAYNTLKSNATMARRAYEALLRIAEKQGKTAEQRSLLREMKERWPGDTAVMNDYAYFSLLDGGNVAECLDIAQSLVARAPASLPHRSTLALALLRSQAPGAALEVYRGLSVPWAQSPPCARAVYAAVLGANGDTAGARQQAAGLHPRDLRPGEVELAKPWMSP